MGIMERDRASSKAVTAASSSSASMAVTAYSGAVVACPSAASTAMATAASFPSATSMAMAMEEACSDIISHSALACGSPMVILQRRTIHIR
ncbi:hypothetical protein GUJ93_ZPchr0002g25229 [Zizania palustris]|uniref:Uncharacterized protein n=1 Tax=Zizania palustris TaxID=103762 RepID=A0A8J5RYL4_ZIZPA|nr:hypothetical protein GUJ93_ZPchr0002g25229 [Zizania palustris]